MVATSLSKNKKQMRTAAKPAVCIEKNLLFKLKHFENEKNSIIHIFGCYWLVLYFV